MEHKKPNELWEIISEDAQRLALFVATGGGLSQGRWILEEFSRDKQMGFDLDKSMRELTDLGILQEVTLVQERKERLAKMPRPRDILLIPLDQLPVEKLKERLEGPSNIEREYLRLAHEIEDFEKNKDKYPERYESWETPRYRLNQEFQDFIGDNFNE